MVPKINAPKSALAMIPISDIKKEVPVIIVKATNKLEPVLIPRISGPARGLLKRFCISNPATESPTPAMIAIKSRGIRKSRAII